MPTITETQKEAIKVRRAIMTALQTENQDTAALLDLTGLADAKELTKYFKPFRDLGQFPVQAPETGFWKFVDSEVYQDMMKKAKKKKAITIITKPGNKMLAAKAKVNRATTTFDKTSTLYKKAKDADESGIDFEIKELKYKLTAISLEIARKELQRLMETIARDLKLRSVEAVVDYTMDELDDMAEARKKENEKVN